MKLSALHGVLKDPSMPQMLHWCNGRLTLVLPHHASRWCSQCGRGVAGWLLLHCCRKRPAGARVFPSSEVTTGPGESRNGVWGAQAQTRAPASLSAVHIPVDLLKLFFREGALTHFRVVSSVVLTLSVTVSKRLHVHQLFLVLYIVRFFLRVF